MRCQQGVTRSRPRLLSSILRAIELPAGTANPVTAGWRPSRLLHWKLGPDGPETGRSLTSTPSISTLEPSTVTSVSTTAAVTAGSSSRSRTFPCRQSIRLRLPSPSDYEVMDKRAYYQINGAPQDSESLLDGSVSQEASDTHRCRRM